MWIVVIFIQFHSPIHRFAETNHTSLRTLIFIFIFVVLGTVKAAPLHNKNIIRRHSHILGFVDIADWYGLILNAVPISVVYDPLCFKF